MTKTTDSYWILELNYYSITLDKRLKTLSKSMQWILKPSLSQNAWRIKICFFVVVNMDNEDVVSLHLLD